MSKQSGEQEMPAPRVACPAHGEGCSEWSFWLLQSPIERAGVPGFVVHVLMEHVAQAQLRHHLEPEPQHDAACAEWWWEMEQQAQDAREQEWMERQGGEQLQEVA